MTAKLNPDIGSGALFAIVGALALYVSADYPRGMLARLGPGAFATGVAYCLIAIGLALVVRGLTHRQMALSFGPLRKPLIVLAATAAFALAFQPFGFFVASFLLIMIASLIEGRKHIVEPIVMFVVLSLFISAIFILGLGVNLPLWMR
jgi:hypothetical protein